jgi:hypothetical protein
MMEEMLFIVCLFLLILVLLKELSHPRHVWPSVKGDLPRVTSNTSSNGSTGFQQGVLPSPSVLYDPVAVQSMRDGYRQAGQRSFGWGARLSGLELWARENTAVCVENWRKSIAGLMGLARRNLLSATAFYMEGNFKGSILASSTGVENISRALIHCYGGKPDQSTGQEEALRLLFRRFDGDERVIFEKAIENVELISLAVAKLRIVSSSVVMSQPSEQEGAKQVLEMANKTTYMFIKIIREKFADEIPELRLHL